MDETNQGQISQWEKAVEQCKRFRDEIRSYPIPKDQMTLAYLFTQEDLDRLLNQGGKKLDGIRAYVGFEEINGKLIPRLYVVGCVKDGTQYNSVVPSQKSGGAENFEEPIIDEGRPCPEDCGTGNGLGG
jgi:hypothetical protein